MRHDRRSRWKWTPRLACLLVVAGVCALGISPTQAQVLNVKVLIEWTQWNDCDDALAPPDIYHIVTIDGVALRSDPITSNFSPFEVDREFSREVDATMRTVPIVIEEWDEDALSDDDHCDIQPGAGRDLELELDLADCVISGDAEGECGESILLSDGSVFFRFTITVEEPPHAAGLSIRCLHDPIWPQVGDSVTITADALDDAAVAKGGVVDDIEIWVDDTTTAVMTTATTPGSFGVNTVSYTHVPAAGATEILYRCRVDDDGEEVSSGWRIVHIGALATSWIRAVPVIYTGPMDSRVDIVFVADDNDYTGADDAQFLTDVHTVIRDAYYAGAASQSGWPFLFNQELFNFWIATDQGTGVAFNTGSHVLPADWGTRYHFADAGAIIHSTAFRDQANRGQRIFSSEPTSLGTVLHESGHTPFGLADEYCCDSNYHQPDPWPNIYSDQAVCLADALASGVADACRQISDGVQTIDWFRLDSHSTVGDDLMRGSGNRAPRAAEERRFDWLFEICRSAGC